MTNLPGARLLKSLLRRAGLRVVPAGSVYGPTDFPEIIRPLIRAKRPVVFDVGANIGQSISEYKALFPDMEIHSFEPDPDCFATLKAKFGTDPSVRLNNLGIADRMTELELQRNTKSATNSFLPLLPKSEWGNAIGTASRDSVTVPVITLDSYCREHGVAQIDLLKLDTQGFEAPCLAGASELLRDNRIGVIRLEVILGEFYSRRSSFADMEQHLAPYGYRLHTLFDISYHADGSVLQLEALYVRDKSPSA